MRPSWKSYPKRKNELGIWLCRLCGQPIAKGRQSYCSRECYETLWKRLNPRSYVLRRDHGICAKCGCDTEKIWRIIKYYLCGWNHGGARGDYMEVLRGCGFNHSTSHFWEADHITPVVLGGHELGLDNLRTLCIPCHKEATRALAKARAELRRQKIS